MDKTEQYRQELIDWLRIAPKEDWWAVVAYKKWVTEKRRGDFIISSDGKAPQTVRAGNVYKIWDILGS